MRTPNIEKYIARAFRPFGDVFTNYILLYVSQVSLVPSRNGVFTVTNPIAPASYPPTDPHVRNVPKQKNRGSDQRGGNASEDMPTPMCNALPWIRWGGLVEQEARGERGWWNSMV
jgi:hypothetical protein